MSPINRNTYSTSRCTQAALVSSFMLLLGVSLMTIATDAPAEEHGVGFGERHGASTPEAGRRAPPAGDSWRVPARALGAELGDPTFPPPPQLEMMADALKPNEDLRLRDALALILAHSPALQAANAEMRAREAERLQAGRLPNPEVTAGVENFSGSGPYARFRGAESTIELSQLIELGGDRASRVRRASAERNLAGWDYETERLSVLTTATERFIDTLAAQKRVDLAQQLFELAERSRDAASKRVAAGKVSPIDLQKAEIAVAQAKMRVERDRSELAAARRRLAILWGSPEARFGTVVGTFTANPQIPPAALIMPYLRENPAIARWADELEARRAQQSLARAQAVPDVTVGLGTRHFQDAGDNALVATVSIPLPIFDRNQGAIHAARHRLDAGEYQQGQAREQVQATFDSAYGRLTAAAHQLRTLDSSILPQAQSVFDAVSTGYREGKFDLLSLLDAQRSLFEARLNAVETQADFLKAKTEIEGLIGRSLASVSTQKGEQGGHK